MASKMIQNNFAGGEISPTLFGRSDLQAYYKGCANAENFIIAKEGTLRKRHGLTSIIDLGEDYANKRIVPYRFDRSIAGLLLVTLNGISLSVTYYLKDGEKKNTVSTTLTEEGGSLANLQSKQIGDQVWITNGKFYKIIQVEEGETISFKEWSNYAETPKVNYASVEASQETHWYAKPSTTTSGRTITYGVVGVKNSVNSSFSSHDVSWSNSWVAGTYINIFIYVTIEDLKKWDEIIVCKRMGGVYGQLTRHYLDDTPDHFFFKTESGYIEVYKGPDDKYFEKQEVFKWADGKYYDKPEGSSGATELTPLTVSVVRFDFKDENISAGEAIYGQTNVLGEGFTNPLCVDCFQQRRVFANAATDNGKNYPMTLWFSEVGNLDNFYSNRPANDADPFSPTISSTGPSFIRWIATYNELMVLFTDSGLFSVGFSQQTGFSADSCRISRFSGLCVSPTVAPIVTEAGIVFVGADNKTVFTAAYDLQENALKPINRSVLVEHLTRKSQIVSAALQESPDNVVYTVTADGRICHFTFERNEDVYAWSHSVIAGARVKDVISLGSYTDSNTDRTYGDILFVVEKDGAYFICKQNDHFTDDIGGSVTNVKATLTTLRPESQEKTIVGAKKNVKDILVRLYESGEVSVRATTGEDLPLVETRGDGSLFTGDKRVAPRGFINPDGQITIVSDTDKPCEILQVVYQMEGE